MALAGLRVVEFGHYIAGPLAGVHLADQGADVVAIRRPDRSVWDADTEEMLARGKRLVEADLRVAADRERVGALVERADVVIENFRPGVMDRLGFGYHALAAVNPAVVYLSLPGFAAADPRAGMRGWDAVVSAACGLFTDLSLAGAVFDCEPTYTPLPLPSIYAGIHGAIAVVAAVYARGCRGVGDRIEVPLLDAAMSAAAGVIHHADGAPDRYGKSSSPAQTPPGDTAALGELMQRASPPLFSNYRCADGKYLFFCALDNENHVRRLLDATELAATARDLGFVARPALDAPPSSDNINAYRGISPRWIELRGALTRVFAQRPAAEWERLLQAAGVPAMMQRSTAEWVRSTVALDAGITRISGPRVEPGPCIDITCAPSTFAHTDDWAAPGPFHPPAAQLQTRAGWLDGVGVLDLSNVIAGPSCGRTLAQLGASVTHIAPPVSKMGPQQTVYFGLDVNRGKASLVVDLKSPQGSQIRDRLLDGADIVTHNCLPRQTRDLGIDPAHVHQINPRAITLAISALAGPNPAPTEEIPGYDPTLQAATGIMTRFGGRGTPALHGLASCVDFLTGYDAAFGAVVALVARDRGARQLHVRTSLARAATWVQLPYLNAEATMVGDGLNARGCDDRRRLFQARDGWLFVSAAPDAVVEPAEFEDRTVCNAVEFAREQGWAAQQVRSARELRAAAVPQPVAGTAIGPSESGRVVVEERQDGLHLRLPDMTWYRSDTITLRYLPPAPTPGTHTAAILATLGYQEQQVAELITCGVVATADTWGDYLPA